MGLSLCVSVVSEGLGFRVDTNKRVDRFTADYITAVISIFFPIGVLLALGRQSSLPVVRWLSILYIEVIRGLPLIGISGSGDAPLVPTTTFYAWIGCYERSLGLILFNAAYMAENVRGGFASHTVEQTKAGSALGLSTPLVLSFIVLPQALRRSSQLVGEFIGLFKDTSFRCLACWVDRNCSFNLAQPQFLGRYAEVYLFIGLIYWVFCYGMSLASQRLERKLNIGQD